MSMKAITLSGFGNEQDLKLSEVSIPQTGANDVLIKVHAFSLNPIDVKARNGHFPILKEEVKITGWDGSGVIESLGTNVSNYKVGDEVYWSGAVNRPGTNAEFVAVDYRLIALKPKSVDHVTASSIPLAALTALEAFEDKFRLEIPKSEGDEAAKFNASKSILVVAGAGGVGSIAIQLARHVFKFGKVIATAGRSESAAWCHNLGAHLIIDRSKDWETQLHEQGIDYVDYVFAGMGTDGIFETLVSITRPLGHICTILPHPTSIDIGPSFMKSLSWHYEFLGSRAILETEPERQHDFLVKLAEWTDAKLIKPWIGTRYESASLENVRAGSILQNSGNAIGKIAFAAIF